MFQEDDTVVFRDDPDQKLWRVITVYEPHYNESQHLEIEELDGSYQMTAYASEITDATTYNDSYNDD